MKQRDAAEAETDAAGRAAPRRAARRVVYVLDADEALREALAVLLALEGYAVRGFADGDALLAAARADVPSCILFDCETAGFAALRALDPQRYPAPVLALSASADVAGVVQAIRLGARDFLLKPVDADGLIDGIKGAVAEFDSRPEPAGAALAGHPTLTPREREVLQQVATGASNKEAGRALGISPRTVEVHRARIMEKLNARNAADLVRIVLGGTQR